jgi:rare lipoprotein A (peptidoglycan hydrolase)
MKVDVEIYEDYYLIRKATRLRNAVILLTCILGAVIICLFSSCQMTPARADVLTASWYSRASLIKEETWKYGERRMANGSTFNDNNFTGASRDFSLGSIVRITNLQTGKSVVIKITDRISRRFKGKRIDLSKSAFKSICDLDKGLCKVRVELI